MSDKELLRRATAVDADVLSLLGIGLHELYWASDAKLDRIVRTADALAAARIDGAELAKAAAFKRVCEYIGTFPDAAFALREVAESIDTMSIDAVLASEPVDDGGGK